MPSRRKMASYSLTPVYLHVCGLSDLTDREIEQSFKSGNPVTASSKCAFLRHWALCVHDTYYEITSIDYKPGIDDPAENYKMKISRKDDWLRLRRHRHVYGIVKVGATVWSDRQIEAQANDLYGARFDKGYELTESNCQNFCRMLHKAISLSKTDRRITESEYQSWSPMPTSVSQIKNFAIRGYAFLGGSSAALFALELSLGAAAVFNPFILVGMGVPYGIAALYKSKDRKYIEKTEKANTSPFEDPPQISTTEKVSTIDSCPSDDSPQNSTNPEFSPVDICPSLADELVDQFSEKALEVTKRALTKIMGALSQESPRYSVVSLVTKQGIPLFWCSDSGCTSSAGRFPGFKTLESSNHHIETTHKQTPGHDPRFEVQQLDSTKWILRKPLRPDLAEQA